MSERQVLINFIAGMSLADHMGDVAENCWQALRQIGIDPPRDIGALNELSEWLEREHGAKSLWGRP